MRGTLFMEGYIGWYSSGDRTLGMEHRLIGSGHSIRRLKKSGKQTGCQRLAPKVQTLIA